ncbi:MAG TPA: IS5 family transposase [Alphaproteobacteria bacterium]|jgi:transposase|nr:IS5 family transposase [Alphaproteobacteria bacterium]
MRGDDQQQSGMFSYISAEQRVPRNHPLRPVRKMVDEALAEMSPRFARLYAKRGRPSIAPEKLLRALLLQVLYTIRSERQLMEQLDYNLLYRWFVGLNMDDAMWDVTVFTKNRERLLKGDIARVLLQKVVEQARAQDLLSEEHFTVDGTLIEAWAGQKSFQRKDGPPSSGGDGGSNPTVDFHGEKRGNQTHQSTSDPEAMLYKKSRGAESKLSYLGHVLMENRNGLVVDTRLTRATGTAERDAALEMAARIPGGTRRVTLGGDKNYDTRDFVDKLRQAAVTPHVARNQHERRSSAIDQRTTRHPGYEISQRKRKRVEEIFGWIKTVGGLRKTRHRGERRVGWMFTLAAAAYNLVRMRNLAPTAA